ncbi:MAG: BsuPI-related putative proteinase inhibitor [Candidatus Aquicultor sp.]
MSASRIVVSIVVAFLVGVLVYAVAARSERTPGMAPDKQMSGDKEARAVVEGSTTAWHVTENHLKITLAISPTTAKQGDLLHFGIFIENLDSKLRELSFTSSQKFDIRVQDKTGRTVWTWSDGKMFTQMLETITLDPHEKTSFTATWSMVDSQGKTVKPGHYEAFIWITASGVNDQKINPDNEVGLGFTIKSDN